MAYSEHGNPVAGTGIMSAEADSRRGWQMFSRSSRVSSLRLDQHEVVFYQGDHAGRVFEVIEGAVMLFKLLPDGRRQVVDVLGVGDVFGLPNGETYDCNAETLTKTMIRAFDRSDAETRTDVQGHITRCLITQVAKLHDHAVLLGRKSALERVASFLIRCVPGCQQPKCGEIESRSAESLVVLTMTRQEIADYLGLTIETVSRVISEFKRKGLISLERQDHIRIKSLSRLCRMSGAH